MNVVVDSAQNDAVQAVKALAFQVLTDKRIQKLFKPSWT